MIGFANQGCAVGALRLEFIRSLPITMAISDWALAGHSRRYDHR